MNTTPTTIHNPAPPAPKMLPRIARVVGKDVMSAGGAIFAFLCWADVVACGCSGIASALNAFARWDAHSDCVAGRSYMCGLSIQYGDRLGFWLGLFARTAAPIAAFAVWYWCASVIKRARESR